MSEKKEMMQDRPISIKDLNRFKEFLNINDELTGLLTQKYQNSFALKETKERINEIKNKKIKEILIPTVGKAFIMMKSGNTEDANYIIKKMEDMERMYNNAIAGIDQQIIHRFDTFKEDARYIFSFLASYLDKEGFNVFDCIPDNIKDKVKK